MSRILTFIFFTATAIVIFFTLTNPILDEIKNLRAEAERLNNVLDQAKEIQSINDDLWAKYNSITQEDIDRINKLLPSEIDAIRIVIEISDIVKRYGLLFKKIEIEGSRKGPSSDGLSESFEVFPVSFAASGSYENFLSFLGGLEDSLRLIEINNLSFSSSDDNFYDFNINAVTFLKK